MGELQAWCKRLEFAHGRRKDSPKFSPRTLDIDLLTVGELTGVQDGVALPRDEILPDVARDPHHGVDAAGGGQRRGVELEQVRQHRLRTALAVAACDADHERPDARQLCDGVGVIATLRRTLVRTQDRVGQDEERRQKGERKGGSDKRRAHRVRMRAAAGGGSSSSADAAKQDGVPYNQLVRAARAASTMMDRITVAA